MKKNFRNLAIKSSLNQKRFCLILLIWVGFICFTPYSAHADISTNPNPPTATSTATATAVGSATPTATATVGNTTSAPPAPANLSEQINQVKPIWKMMLQFVDYIVVAFLIFIAFVNIMRINIDTYAIKKTLPSLILAVILANFSWWICKMFIDLANVIVQSLGGAKIILELYKGIFHEPSNWNFAGGASAATLGIFATVLGLALPGGVIVAFIIGIIAALIPLILFIISYFFLFIRTYIIDLLVVASPLAFMAMGLPLTTKLFQQWWSQFTKWIFLAPVMMLMWYVAAQIANLAGSALGVFTKYVLICTAVYLALRVPLMLGGGIAAAWGGLGKNLGGKGLSRFGKIADKNFGKSFGWSPYTAVKGWGENAEKDWERHVKEHSGAGEDLRQKITSAGGNVGKIVDELKAGTLFKGENAIRVAIEQALERGKAIATNDNYTRENLKDMHDVAINKGNETEAKEILLARAMRGELTSEDIDAHLAKFDSLYKKTSGQEINGENLSLINNARNAAMSSAKDLGQDGNPIVVNNYGPGKDGRFRRLGKNEVAKDGSDRLTHTFENDRSMRPQLIRNAASMLTQTDIANFRPEHIAAARFLDGIAGTGLGKAEISKLGPKFQQDFANLKDKLDYGKNFANPGLNLPTSEINRYTSQFEKNPANLNDEERFVISNNADEIHKAAAKIKFKDEAMKQFKITNPADKAKLDQILDNHYNQTGEMTITAKSQAEIDLKKLNVSDVQINNLNQTTPTIKAALDSQLAKMKNLIPVDIANVDMGIANVKTKIQTDVEAQVISNVTANASVLKAGLDKTFEHKLNVAVAGLKDPKIENIIKLTIAQSKKFSAPMKAQVLAQAKNSGAKIDMNDLENRLNTLQENSDYIAMQHAKVAGIEEKYKNRENEVKKRVARLKQQQGTP